MDSGSEGQEKVIFSLRKVHPGFIGRLSTCTEKEGRAPARTHRIRTEKEHELRLRGWYYYGKLRDLERSVGKYFAKSHVASLSFLPPSGRVRERLGFTRVRQSTHTIQMSRLGTKTKQPE